VYFMTAFCASPVRTRMGAGGGTPLWMAGHRAGRLF
jgi:hypothetical protein